MSLRILSLLALAALPLGAAENLLANPGLETLQPDGTPAGWQAFEFKTGGRPSVGRDGGHGGQVYVALKSADERQRACWRQKVAVPEGTRAIAFGGWYRTRGVAAAPNRGASLRVLFHRDLAKWDELGLKQAFFPPSESWREAKGVLALPEGTRAVVLEAFCFYAPGETDWDDLWLQPTKEVPVSSTTLPPELAVDRDPVPGANLPYHPADGQTVTLNPPPFRWLPSGQATYRLEIGRDAALKGAEVIRLEGLEWCAEMLTQPLAEGTWYWRYGVDRRGGPTLWSRVRRFEVPAGAAPWAYPGREALRVDARRPHLFVTAAGLPALRRRAKDGDLKALAAGMVASVQRNLNEALVPEPAKLSSDPDARRWQYTKTFRDTRPPMDVMERAALAYLLTADPACGAEAKRRVLHFFAWDPHGSTSVFHNDEPAMWVMMRGVRAYDWTYDLYTPEERVRVEAAMKERAADFYAKLRSMPYDNNPYESHAGRIIGFLGEAALEFLNEWPEARTWADYVTRIYWGVWPAWGQDDGGWNEGPGYWSAYMTFALHYVVALKQATGIDLARRPFFHQTPYYRLYLTAPGSKMSAFGDGTQFQPSGSGALMYQFSTLCDDPVLRWAAEAQNAGPESSILGVVLKDDRLLAQPPAHLPQGRLFDGAGLATLHTALADPEQDVFFALRSSPYGAVSHGHNDQNCFVLEAFGEPLAIATGYYPSYGSPHHDQWTRSTKAKCGLTYDGGQGQDRGWAAQGKVTGFVSGEGFDLVVGDATKAYGGRLSRAVRQVVQVRPGLFVIRDVLASATPRRFEFQLHALDRMTVDEATRTVTTSRPKASLQTTFVLPERVAFAQTDQYSPAPETVLGGNYVNTWHLTAGLPEPAGAATFLTVLSPARAGDEADRPTVRRLDSGTADAVELTWPDGRRAVVAFRRGEGRCQAGELDSDGEVAAVACDRAGTPTAWLLHGGRELKARGAVLATAAAAGTLTAAVDADGGSVDTGAAGSYQVAWPHRPTALTRAGQILPAPASPALTVSATGRERFEVWDRAPVPSGPVGSELRAGGQTFRLSGLRSGRGPATLTGLVSLPPGGYRAELPAGATLKLGVPQDGVHWLRGRETATLTGQELPNSVGLTCVLPAAALAAQPREQVGDGLSVEAEQGYTEAGGRVEVSGGHHAGASGRNNLWGWNAPGHTLGWELSVPRAGRYHLWVVGATESGLLATLAVDQRAPLGLWFEPSGGWARTNASEWRGYLVGDGAGPLALELTAGPHRLTLVNRTGLGLNLDRFVLVPAG